MECTIYDVIGNLSFLRYDLMNLLWHLNDYSVYQQCYTVFGHKSEKNPEDMQQLFPLSHTKGASSAYNGLDAPSYF